MKKLILAFLSLNLITITVLFAAGCIDTKNSEAIVEEETVEKYLDKNSFIESTELERISSNISFWEEKLNSDPSSITYRLKLGSAYSQRFSVLKDIQDLQRADSLFNEAHRRSSVKRVDSYHALADLSITKHRFRDAFEYSSAALEVGDEKRTSMLLIYDSMMERGDYMLAKKTLDRLKNEYSFPYLIRLSKYKDYEGELDSAIHYMKEAHKLVEHSKRLSAWSKSNLADMYGHANEIHKSYRAYLDVLQMGDTGGAYLHSLQGLAWIAYAHDGNVDLAQRILTFVDDQLKSPDIKLKLAELAEYEQNEEERKQYVKAFVEEAQKPAYYGMYDPQLAVLAGTEDLEGMSIDASSLMNKELLNRPTPGMYDLKAWISLQAGSEEEALELVEKHVSGQTHEPVAVYHMARIYKANGMNDKAARYFRNARDAAYELGPVTTRDINAEMQDLRTGQ